MSYLVAQVATGLLAVWAMGHFLGIRMLWVLPIRIATVWRERCLVRSKLFATAAYSAGAVMFYSVYVLVFRLGMMIAGPNGWLVLLGMVAVGLIIWAVRKASR